MNTKRADAPRGRQKEADANDARLMRAAHEVFAELGWDAPVSEIARRAGIGMGSLYRRFPSKEALAQRMLVAAMDQLTAQARAARTQNADPWTAFTGFLRNAVSARSSAGTLLPLLGGRLPTTDESEAAAERLQSALDDLVGAAHGTGALRDDFGSADVPLLLEHLTVRTTASDERSAALRVRYLELVLVGLRGSVATRGLQGPAPDWAELRALWNAP